ncbi:MAG: DUF3416 domain-containing protein, partial [Gemmatimonadetes bacterium]|nr:DUF3416 domain-containing protein [Gemmatimonadota bacterium]
AHARDELQGVPLSGIVVVSDGGDNTDEAIGDALLPLRAASVPVFTVGVGDEEMEADVQASRVDVPETALTGTSMVVNVMVDSRGYAGRTVPIVVEDMGRIVTTEMVELPADGQPLVAPVAITLETPGARELAFRIPGQSGERVLENNVLHSVVQVRDRTEKILYFEGEPRHEVAFMLRAVRADENLQVVLLQRTAENKFFRRNLDDPLELVEGFPTTREDLYRYRALVLGSIEASFFTHDQLDMMADFVSERGGTLLMLGGRRALAEGGYKGTPLEDVLPVVLDEPTGSTPTERLAFVKVSPTPGGANHPITRIESTVEESAARWDSLPPVSTTNLITELKPGATELLQGVVVESPGAAPGAVGAAEDAAGLESTGDAGDRVVMAFQRYGRGRSMVLAVQDTWLWQMDSTVPLEDLSHENFWRQLMRWLVAETPDPVEAAPAQVTVEAGEPVTLEATVLDAGFVEVNGAAVNARVTLPTGETRNVPMEWSVSEDGRYTADFTPDMDGIFEVSVNAGRDTVTFGNAETSVRVAPGTEEFRDPRQRVSLMERIAEETGGRYYTPETAANLPEDLQFTGGGVTVTEERDLWDMPILFLLLAGLMGGEWVYRRKRGMARRDGRERRLVGLRWPQWTLMSSSPFSRPPSRRRTRTSC